VELTQPEIDNVAVTLVNVSNALEMSATDIKMSATSKFKYKYELLEYKGSLDIKVTNVKFDVQVALSQQTGTPDYTIAPKVTVTKLDLDVSSKHTSIKFHGKDIVTQIVKLLEPLVQKTFEKDVVKGIKKQMTKIIDTTVDEDLSIYGTQASIPQDSNIIVDYGMFGDSPMASDGVLNIDVNGTFFNVKKSSPSRLTPVDFSKFENDGKELWMLVSGYSFYTLFTAFFHEIMATDGMYAEESIDPTILAHIISFKDVIEDLIDDHRDMYPTLADFIETINQDLNDEFKLPLNYQGIDFSKVWFEIHNGYVAAGMKATTSTWETIGAVLSQTHMKLSKAASPIEAPLSFT
jgi:hypothetical protein